MSIREPDNSQLRDNLLAKLLAESLASSASASAAPRASCPDAETIAAYAERSLAPEEAARLDAHFADCARCQTVLAAMVRSLDAAPANVAAAESPVELTLLASIPQVKISNRPAKPAASAAAAVLSSVPSSKIRTLPLPQRTRWRELAPALGIAAAVALWFALQPAPPTQNLSAQLRTDAETSGQQAPAPPLPPANNPEIAEANIPSPPVPPPAEQGEPQRPSADASQAEALKKETFQSPAAPTDALQQKDLRNSQTAQQLQNRDANAAPAAAPAPAEPRHAAQAAINSASGSATPRAESDRANPRAAHASPFAPSATEPSAASEAKAAAPGNGIASAAPGPPIMALAKAPLPVFASPNRAVMWRVGPGGSIERSTDRGQTWEKRVSGVTTELVAGAASSNEVAWIVGRAGVILRTTDGVNWQRVSPPLSGASVSANASAAESPAPTASGGATPARSAGIAGSVAGLGAGKAPNLDLATVEVRDALHATVTSADGRRFITSDGGQTWISR